MATLLISAVAGAIATGAVATAVMMTAPAYAQPPAKAPVDALPWVYVQPSAYAVPPAQDQQVGAAQILAERAGALVSAGSGSGPQGPALPPVCICSERQATAD